MGVFDLYSYRKRVAEGDTPDVLVYDDLPNALRVQIIGIWDKAIGPYSTTRQSHLQIRGRNNATWQRIHSEVAHEHGVANLAPPGRDPADRCKSFLLQTDSVDDALDLIEHTFGYVDKEGRRFGPQQRKILGIGGPRTMQLQS